jgi:hypothetical protein
MKKTEAQHWQIPSGDGRAVMRKGAEASFSWLATMDAGNEAACNA